MSGIAKAVPAPHLRTALTHGALWTILAALTGKLLSIGAQWGLAIFLTPADFGLVAVVLAVGSSLTIFGGTHLSTLLVQQQERFDLMAGQVFWLALSMSSFGGLLLAIGAPMAAAYFGQPQITPLMLVVAAACPLLALPTIYSASLAKELRFATVSQIAFIVGLLQNGASLLLAWGGLGPYALLLPLWVTAIASALLYRFHAGRIPIPQPRPTEWIPLLAAAFWILVNSLCLAARGYGPNLVAGAVAREPDVVGYFYWGASITFQAIFLLATALQGVFFPAFTRLKNDPGRQISALRRSNHLLACLAGLVCVAQVLLAGPLLTAMFGEKWVRAVPVIQWLSITVITQPLNMIASALLLARGEFKLIAGVNACAGIIVVLAAGIGASLGMETQIAQWTAFGTMIANVLPLVICCRKTPRQALLILGEVGSVMLMSAVAAGAGFMGGWLCRSSGAPLLVEIGVTGASITIVYSILAYFTARQVVSELVAQFTKLVQAFTNRLVAT